MNRIVLRNCLKLSTSHTRYQCLSGSEFQTIEPASKYNQWLLSLYLVGAASAQ